MTITVRVRNLQRRADAAGVLCARNVAVGHQILPPRTAVAGGFLLFRSARRAPPT